MSYFTHKRKAKHPWKVRHFSLTFVLLVLFLLSIAGHIHYGFKAHNEDLKREGQPAVESVGAYLSTGHFISSISENMESEFLQMALFVYLTMCLHQRGSAESKIPDEDRTKEELEFERADHAYSEERLKEHPIAWRLYENSLTIVLTLLFLISFAMHAYGSFKMINEENQAVGQAAIAFTQVFGEPEFWFESFQNWQSEFFSIAVIVVLSIFLRQRGSAQSKKMKDPVWKTGGG